MRILLADANPEVLAALRLVLEQQPGFFVTGESGGTVNLFAQVTNHCPHVLLLDIDLPGLVTSRRFTKSPLAELVETLRLLCPSLRIIALSSRPDSALECLSAGADAFVCKSDPPDALLSLLRSYALLGEYPS